MPGFPWPLLPGNSLSDVESVPNALQNLSLGFYANPDPFGATPTIDWRRGATQTATLNANCTLTFIAPNKPGRLQLVLTEDGTGYHTVTKPGDGVWEQGSAPLPVGPGTARVYDIIYDGSSYRMWYSATDEDGLLTIATSTGSTLLTAPSPPVVLLTGTQTHQLYMPSSLTLRKGWSVLAINTSTGNVLLRSYDGSLLGTLPAGSSALLVFNGTTASEPLAWVRPLTSLTFGVTGILGTANGGTGVDNSTGGTANTFWARPNGGTGAATYRAIVAADLPDISGTYLTVSAASATYLTIASAASTYQPLDADLTALAALDPTAGILVKTGANAYTRFGAATTITPSTTPTVNFAANPNQSLALSGNTTFTFSDPSISGYVTLKNSDSVGGRTRSFPGNVTWVSGRAPRTLTAGETQIITGWFDGATHWMDYTPSSKDRVTVTGTTVTADGDMANSTAELWSDDTAGNPAIGVKFSDSAGTKLSAVVRTNKPRVVSTTSSATPSINTDVTDVFRLTALAANITSFTANLTGAPAHGQKLRIEIVATATRTIAWGSSFENGTNFVLPTTTIGTEQLNVDLTYNSATSKWQAANGEVNSITFSFDGGGSAITTGAKAVINVPYSHEIISAHLKGAASGSLVVDVWRAANSTSTNPTVSDTITASAKPTLSSATGANDTTLTGWNKVGAAGSDYRANVDSCTTTSVATLTLKVRKAG